MCTLHRIVSSSAILLLGTASLWSQVEPFSSRLDHLDAGLDDQGESVVETQEGHFLLFGGCTEPGDQGSRLCVSAIDGTGIPLWVYSYYAGDGQYFSDDAAWGGRARSMAGGNILFASGHGPSAADSRARLWMLDVDGDTIWTREVFHGTGTGATAHEAVETADGGIAMIGTVQGPGDLPQAFVCKFSSTGDSLWSRVFTAPLGGHARRIEPTEDGGVLVLSWKQADPSPSLAWLHRLDVTGAIIWESAIGFTNAQVAQGMTLSSDGRIILVGQEGMEIEPDFYVNRPHVAICDSLGQLEQHWSTGQFAYYSFLQDVTTLMNGTIVAVGLDREGTTNTGSVYCFTPEGDSLWYHRFVYPPDQGIWGFHFLLNVVGDSDGGMVACGIASGGSTPGTDQWLLRTDAQGATPPTLLLWTTTPEQPSGNAEPLVYPNPTDGLIFIRPEVIRGARGALSVCDPTGRRVWYGTLAPEKSVIPVDLSILIGGAYTVIVDDGYGHRSYQRLIKN